MFVNNHIHTTYSFSPYTPSQAVRKAREAGLLAAGIVDHDSVAGAEEFIAEGKKLSLPVTVGFEMRVRHAHTAIGNRRTNHPDQTDLSYLTFHGVPHNRLNAVTEFLEPVRAARGIRNRAMCERLNLDYELDVLPLSQYANGGAVTERHILFALAKSDYAELARLKSSFTDYIPAGHDECPTIEDTIVFAKKNGIIAAYAYLGDVTQSVTGDKKPQSFEDSYLEELFEILHSLGIRAVTYMPARNTRAQLIRVRALCDKYQMLQICGEDINAPGQSFICEALKDPLFSNLVQSTWALIGHEKAAGENIASGFTESALPLKERVEYFAKIGKSG